MSKNAPNYSFIAKTLHWGFVIFFAYGIIKSVDELEQLENSSFLRFEFLFASAFLILLALRFFYMKKTQNTSLPAGTGKLQRLAAKIVHLGMYMILAVIALTGLIIGLLFWMGFQSFFLIALLVTLHEFAIQVMYWLIFAHISAAIYHRLRKDGVWNSMVPFWKE